jgi:hypothetical protein
MLSVARREQFEIPLVPTTEDLDLHVVAARIGRYRLSRVG